jgi:hypothetical protein
MISTRSYFNSLFFFLIKNIVLIIAHFRRIFINYKEFKNEYIQPLNIIK